MPNLFIPQLIRCNIGFGPKHKDKQRYVPTRTTDPKRSKKQDTVSVQEQ